MKIDRRLQNEMLERIQAKYPQDFTEIGTLGEKGQVYGNLFYLHELGLVTLNWSDYNDNSKEIHLAKITAKGIDFLADDGGVGAILGTVTVKLHEDTLRRLIEAKVQSSDLPVEEKNGILKALREAPGETIRHLTTKLVDLGLENSPKALPLFQTWLQSGHS